MVARAFVGARGRDSEHSGPYWTPKDCRSSSSMKMLQAMASNSRFRKSFLFSFLQSSGILFLSPLMART